MTSILITGGAGDWAKSFQKNHHERFDITTVDRKNLDVTSTLCVERYFKNKQFDIVINNAGSIHPKRVLDTDSQLWINDINVNLVGTFLISKSALITNSKTIIINISSTAAFNVYADWSSYCASKAGVVTLTKCLANDGFQAYCLCPGAIDTKFRNKFNLSNDNVMNCDQVSQYVLAIINRKYTSGDVLFFRKNEFKLNP